MPLELSVPPGSGPGDGGDGALGDGGDVALPGDCEVAAPAVFAEAGAAQRFSCECDETDLDLDDTCTGDSCLSAGDLLEEAPSALVEAADVAGGAATDA